MSPYRRRRNQEVAAKVGEVQGRQAHLIDCFTNPRSSVEGPSSCRSGGPGHRDLFHVDGIAEAVSLVASPTHHGVPRYEQTGPGTTTGHGQGDNQGNQPDYPPTKQSFDSSPTIYNRKRIMDDQTIDRHHQRQHDEALYRQQLEEQIEVSRERRRREKEEEEARYEAMARMVELGASGRSTVVSQDGSHHAQQPNNRSVHLGNQQPPVNADRDSFRQQPTVVRSPSKAENLSTSAHQEGGLLQRRVSETSQRETLLASHDGLVDSAAKWRQLPVEDARASDYLSFEEAGTAGTVDSSNRSTPLGRPLPTYMLPSGGGAPNPHVTHGRRKGNAVSPGPDASLARLHDRSGPPGVKSFDAPAGYEGRGLGIEISASGPSPANPTATRISVASPQPVVDPALRSRGPLPVPSGAQQAELDDRLPPEFLLLKRNKDRLKVMHQWDDAPDSIDTQIAAYFTEQQSHRRVGH